MDFDEKLETLGLILANKNCRSILFVLSGKEMYAAEISKLTRRKKDNLTAFHLEKFEKLGILKITTKQMSGITHVKRKYYSIDPMVLEKLKALLNDT